MRINGRQIAVGAAAICLATTTACTGGSGGSTATSSTGSSATPTTASSSGDFSKPTANDVALRKNVTLSSCERHHGKSTASGTATNPTTSKITYHLTVYYTTTKATDLAAAWSDVTVPANGSAQWTASASFAYNPTVRCVLVGVAKAKS